MIFQKDWYEAIQNDPYVETNEQEMAYILYAAMIYCIERKCIDIGEVFGKEFKGLNRSMPNIYSQIDRIKIWSDNMNEGKRKYDAERIKELRLEGKTAREICMIEGYDIDKANNLTSNKGWIEAGKILKERKKENLEKSVQKNPENPESVQKNTDLENSGKNLENLGTSGFIF